jgi:hypothetical protein
MTHWSEQSAASKCPMDISQFGVLIVLQKLRAQIHTWRIGTAGDLDNSEAAQLIGTLRALGTAARTAGLDAYGCICLHLAEQIADLRMGGRLSRNTMKLLSEWGIYSDCYLRHPREPGVVMTMIMHLNHPKWRSPFCPLEQNMLSRALLDPSTQ